MHNGFYICTTSGVWGFVIPVVPLCMGRSACKDQEFREKGQLWAHAGEVQSRFAHTRFRLALLVQHQNRRGMMSK